MIKQKGMTVLEILLVVVIGGAIVLMGVNQYNSYRLVADARQVKYSIDVLTQAAAQYYRASCNITATSQLNSPLDPTTTPNTVPIDIAAVLQAGGFLTQTIASNPLVDDTAAGTWQGYTVVLKKTTADRNICVEGSNATGLTPAKGCTQTQKIGTTVNWSIQVGVVLKKPEIAKYILGLSNGSCVSSLQNAGAGTFPVACSQATTYGATCQSASEGMTTAMNGINDAMNQFNSGDCFSNWTQSCNDIFNNLYLPSWNNYMNNSNDYNNTGCNQSTSYNNVLAFESLPSMDVSPETQSGLWLMSSTLTKTKQSYSSDSITTLTGKDHTTEFQYFSYCGN